MPRPASAPPRPATAHVAYGSLAVVLSTFAMLLLSGARSGAAVVVIGAAGLLVGLLVASVLVLRGSRRPAEAASPAVSLPRQRVPAAPAEPRDSLVSETFLRS